ncbi:FecR domain-containing protein [Nitrospirillum sp. BR 11164]|uniref:FecR family protein n=1 Tax=Nitrospirillum sp. BR 11164 TaxID=3104324 RepID=UPI002AFF0B96|nr:FecR domain-containing protein [Nitrospirillum sp. BR 11164]MEA1648211.1 FecR domain-containing protein [Nitrospirillum sp. BR 11164]
MMEHDPIEEQAARWLARQDAGPLDAAAKAGFDAWIATSTRHRVTYLRLEAAWRRADQLRATRQAPALPLPRTSMARAPWRRWAPAMATAAAVALVVIVPMMDDWDWPFAAGQKFSTGVGDRYTAHLQDGSQIELNTNTRLRASVDQTAREVRLDKGEAFFEVVHDDKHPFVVISGDLRIVDVGTKFSVRRDGDRLEVVVAEGAVLVEDMAHPNDVAPTLVTQLSAAVAQPKAIRKSPRSEEQVRDSLGWRHGTLVFNDRPLREVATEFNRYNRKQLVVPAEGPMGDIRIGGSFEATNVDAFARLLHSGFGLKIVDDGREIRISN